MDGEGERDLDDQQQEEIQPLYVNVKQYCRILKRRQKRAKLEAQNRLVKSRKPYLYESRHQHAIKRKRDERGHFVAKEATESDPSSSEEEHVEFQVPVGHLFRIAELQSREKTKMHLLPRLPPIESILHSVPSQSLEPLP